MGARWYDVRIGRWVSADIIVPDPLDPQSYNRYSYVGNQPLVHTDPSGHIRIPWQVRYAAMQAAMTLASSLCVQLYVGPIALPIASPPLMHGRSDALMYGGMIAEVAGPDALIVAASIAHQASDAKDRPFGTAYGLDFVGQLLDINPSLGIAQVRSTEVGLWAPGLAGQSPLDPLVSISAMAGKLSHVDRAIQVSGANIGVTDRFMLLAVAQNFTGKGAISNLVQSFVEAGMDWAPVLTGDAGRVRNLRYVALHLMWLAENGYALPEGLEMDYWLEEAFTDVEGVD